MKASYNNGVYSPKKNWDKPVNYKLELLSIAIGLTVVAVITLLAANL